MKKTGGRKSPWTVPLRWRWNCLPPIAIKMLSLFILFTQGQHLSLPLHWIALSCVCHLRPNSLYIYIYIALLIYIFLCLSFPLLSLSSPFSISPYSYSWFNDRELPPFRRLQFPVEKDDNNKNNHNNHNNNNNHKNNNNTHKIIIFISTWENAQNGDILINCIKIKN